MIWHVVSTYQNLINPQVFILGVNFQEGRLVSRALQHFYGIGPLVARQVMARFHIHPTAKVGALAQKQVLDLTAELSNMHIENDLRREMRDNIARLRDMKSYRGTRHAMGLPVRGQRTRTQTNTANKLNKVERKG
jgi:small subunit ribosomal protein S13